MGVGAGHGQSQCSNIVAGVKHMEPGDVSDVIFVMSRWESWLGDFVNVLVLWTQRVL